MKYYFSFWVFVILQWFFPANELNAQNQNPECKLKLCGRVIDEHDRSNLPFATLIIVENGMTTLSDEEGNFCFAGLCPGNYTLISKHIGCDDVNLKVSLNSSKNINVFQEHHSQALSELIVHEHKAHEKSSLNSTEISGLNLIENSGKPLAEILNSVAGISSINTGNTIAKPVIHGLHSNRVLIMNNGVRQEGQQWGNEHGPEIDPFISDKITVIKGAATVRFGPDAIGGVILADPRPLPDSNAYTGQIHLAGFSNGQMGVVSANTEGAPSFIKGLSYRLQGTLKKGGNQKTPKYYLGNTGVEEANFSFQSMYDREDWGIEYYYSQFNSNIGILSSAHIGNLSDLQRAFNSAEPLENFSFSYNINRPYQHLIHELSKVKTWYSWNKSRLWISYARQYNLREEYDKDKALNDSLAALNRPELKFEITSHNTEIVFENPVNRNLHFMAGLSGIWQGNTYEGRFFIPNFKSIHTGGFVISQWKNPFWFLELGIRYDFRNVDVYLWEAKQIVHKNHQFSGFSSTLGLKRNFKTGTFFMNFGNSWRAPNVSELYSKGVHHGAASIENGDPGLEQEKSINLQTGYEWQSENKWHGEILIYNKYINNFIWLVPQNVTTLTIRGAFPTFNYEKINANLSGADAIIFIPIYKNLELKNKMSWLYAINSDTKTKIVNMPCNSIENTLNFRLNDGKKLLENRIGLGGIWVSEMKNLPSGSDYVNPPKDYFLLNFSLSSEVIINKQKMSLSIQVSNLLNRNYRNYLNRFRYYADETGRNISLHAKIPFQIN